jgi:hypothetical protein
MNIDISIRRSIAGGLAAAALGSLMTIGAASADPGRVTAGPLSAPRASLAGWNISGPDAEGTIAASVKLPGKTWESAIELGVTGADGRTSQDVARSIVLNAPRTPGYAKNNARVVGLAVTPTSISGVPATRATASIEVQGAPVRADRFHVVVVDTKPQTYFVSAVPFEAADRIAQANAAEAGLIANR